MDVCTCLRNEYNLIQDKTSKGFVSDDPIVRTYYNTESFVCFSYEEIIVEFYEKFDEKKPVSLSSSQVQIRQNCEL